MTAKDLRLLADVRAEQLAYIVLTRRDDLSVMRNQRLGGLDIDLTVTVLQNGRETGQVFGVEVKGVRSKAGLRRASPGEVHLMNATFPFVQIVFSMDDDKGYWRWLVEPASEINARSGTVRLHSEGAFEPLTNEAVADIVARVRQWYDARLAVA